MKARIRAPTHSIIAFAFMLLVLLAHADIETDNRNYRSKSARTQKETRPNMKVS